MPASRTLILPPRKAPPPGRHQPGRFRSPASRIALSWPRPRTRQPGLSPGPAPMTLILAIPQASPSCRSFWPHPRPRPHNAHPGPALESAPTTLLLTLSPVPAPSLPPSTALGPPPLQSWPGFRPVSRQRCGPAHVMAPEENAGTELLLQSFERRFLAARTLRSFPWQSLEAKLRHSSDSELLRDILQKHEVVHTETLDELYEALVETLMSKESTQGHRSYLLASGGSVILSESTAIISHGTTGLVTWDAALYLAEWAIENPAAFTHRRAVLPRSHRVAGRGPVEAGCLPGVQAGSCGLSGLQCPQPRDGPAVHHGARLSLCHPGWNAMA
nr:uncharacterized protein LOC100451720 isoform X4 [Pongo abelii]